MRLAIKRLARAAAIAAAIIASSSTLEVTGQPLFMTLGEVAFNLAGVFSEVEEVRRKITEARVMATQEANRFPRMRG
jgi:hypothetical protein